MGVNSAFDVKDTVYILSENEYNNLNDKTNTNAVKQIAKLNETITDLK